MSFKGENEYTPADLAALWQQTLDSIVIPRLEEERAHRQLAAELPFNGIESNPTLAADFVSLAEFAIGFQRDWKATPDPVFAERVHILTPASMSQALQLLDLGKSDRAAYDPRYDILYVPEPEPDSMGLIRYNYTLAHEVGHKLTPGLNGGPVSFLMREGIADIFARQFMQSTYLPSRYPEMADRISLAFGASTRPPYRISNVPLEPAEVLCVDPDTLDATEYPRFLETRIVRVAKDKLSPEGFIRYMQLAMCEDTGAPFQFLGERLGLEVASLLLVDPDRVPSHLVLRELQNRSGN